MVLMDPMTSCSSSRTRQQVARAHGPPYHLPGAFRLRPARSAPPLNATLDEPRHEWVEIFVTARRPRSPPP